MFEVKEPSLEKKIDDLVKRTVDFMMSLQFTSGNCPMAMCWEAKKLKHPGDKIVRWSQGAPVWIYMFIEAHKRSPNNNKTENLEATKRCAEVRDMETWDPPEWLLLERWHRRKCLCIPSHV